MGLFITVFAYAFSRIALANTAMKSRVQVKKGDSHERPGTSSDSCDGTAEVQIATVVSRWPGQDGFGAGTVYNVIARLKGTASTHAILLDAHYDSGSTGPGASDDGSGVVTLLETMRALKAGPPLKNDVIFVFADGEEYGDLGARAFATQHPWMQEVGLAINFEAQGSSGPAYVYDTSQQNGWLINEFLKAAPYPMASSFVVNIATTMPEQQPGCDLEEYMAPGSAGLDIIYTGNTPAYHTMQDNVQTIDAGSLQHEGAYTLALVRHFGTMDLTQVPTTPNDVFFNIGPGLVVPTPRPWSSRWQCLWCCSSSASWRSASVVNS
jgi:Zn-dependent M28 family amino/carboxypeptidase